MHKKTYPGSLPELRLELPLLYPPSSFSFSPSTFNVFPFGSAETLAVTISSIGIISGSENERDALTVNFTK